MHSWLFIDSSGGISSSVLSVFFTDNCYKLLKSLHLIGWEQIYQWKTLTKRLMKCPPEHHHTAQTSKLNYLMSIEPPQCAKDKQQQTLLWKKSAECYCGLASIFFKVCFRVITHSTNNLCKVFRYNFLFTSLYFCAAHNVIRGNDWPKQKHEQKANMIHIG